MQKAEDEYRREQVRGLDVEVLLEASVVVETLVDDAERDHGVHQEVVPGDLVEGREDQRDAVAHREHGDELGNLAERGEEEHHAEEEQQVVVAREHVARTEADVLQVATVEHALAVGFRDAMGECRGRQQQCCHGAEPGRWRS
jgi:hypothetical protein